MDCAHATQAFDIAAQGGELVHPLKETRSDNDDVGLLQGGEGNPLVTSIRS